MADNAKDSKLIFSPHLANFLLSKGFNIIKLKPKRGTENESVFVFHLGDGFYDAVNEWKSQNQE